MARQRSQNIPKFLGSIFDALKLPQARSALVARAGPRRAEAELVLGVFQLDGELPISHAYELLAQAGSLTTLAAVTKRNRWCGAAKHRVSREGHDLA